MALGPRPAICCSLPLVRAEGNARGGTGRPQPALWRLVRRGSGRGDAGRYCATVREALGRSHAAARAWGYLHVFHAAVGPGAGRTVVAGDRVSELTSATRSPACQLCPLGADWRRCEAVRRWTCSGRRQAGPTRAPLAELYVAICRVEAASAGAGHMPLCRGLCWHVQRCRM